MNMLYFKYNYKISTIFFFPARWNYCYTCILEETVRRRRRMFSWEHIKNHRNTMKKYKEAYIKKLSIKKVSSDVKQLLEVRWHACMILFYAKYLTLSEIALFFNFKIYNNFFFLKTLISLTLSKHLSMWLKHWNEVVQY